jgi:hypothetical protein
MEFSTNKLVKERRAEKFCKSLRPGELNIRSVCFQDTDGAIYRRTNHGEPQLEIPKRVARNEISKNHFPIFAVQTGRKQAFETK